MASFQKNISGKYGVKTYQETKNTYDWIIKAIHKEFDAPSIKPDFYFCVSGIDCSCDRIEEFVENAYEQVDYHLTTMSFGVYSNDTRIAFILVKYDNAISVSAESRVMLEKIVKLLETTTLDETEVNDPISVTYIETQVSDGGMLIQGNNNNVANNNSSVNVHASLTAPKMKLWFDAILQNLLANGVWYLLSGAIGAVITFLATK